MHISILFILCLIYSTSCYPKDMKEPKEPLEKPIVLSCMAIESDYAKAEPEAYVFNIENKQVTIRKRFQLAVKEVNLKITETEILITYKEVDLRSPATYRPAFYKFIINRYTGKYIQETIHKADAKLGLDSNMSSYIGKCETYTEKQF